MIFASTPASRKHEFPGALPPSIPLSNGNRNSPVPAPTPTDLPAPMPAPAQLPPPPPIPIIAATPKPITDDLQDKRQPIVSEGMTVVGTTVSNTPPASSVPSIATMPNVPVPVTMPQPAAAPVVHHPPALDSATPGSTHVRTESPAVATSAPSYHTPYQPLYTPYASHTPYTTAPIHNNVAPATTVTAPSQKETVASRPSSSPRGHSPTRERESYRYGVPSRNRVVQHPKSSPSCSSNVSSLSRSSVTPISHAPPTTVSSSLSLGKSWSGPTPQLSPAPPRPTPPLQSSFPPPMFTTPLPPPVSAASSLPSTVPPPNPNPFSAESLFQTNQADMLRRELDNRFLASQDRSLNVAPPPYLRTEMHQHQHHHTHVHQHTTSLLPPPPSSTLFPSPLVSYFDCTYYAFY